MRAVDGTRSLNEGGLTADFFLAAFFARALDELALAMAQLLGQPVRDDIDGLVKLMAMVFRVNIGPRQRQVDLDDEGVFERPFVVVPKGDVRADEVQAKMFQAFDFLGHIAMDGWRQLYITGADMYLHMVKLHSRYEHVHRGKNFWKAKECEKGY